MLLSNVCWLKRTPVEHKKKKLKAVSREELINKFGMHTPLVENSQDELSETTESEDVKNTSSKEPDTDVHIESEKIIDDEKRKQPDIDRIDLNKVDVICDAMRGLSKPRIASLISTYNIMCNLTYFIG